MTFEEFFHKKKIDLLQLQKAEVGLFAEFKSHYEQMGAKSFDHSKKFWFNKLRRLYHIKEEPKPAKTSVEIKPIASQPEPISTSEPELKKGFTPRFKAKTKPGTEITLPEENKISDEPKPALDSTKPTFKPRFKPQMAKPAIVPPSDPEQSAAIEKEEESKPEQSKPAYKPRFKAPVTSHPESVPEEKTTSEEQPKPAYKPRFKPQMIKPSEPVLENNKINESKVEESVPKSLPLDIEPKETPEKIVNLGFKPKFTPKNFKPKSEG